MKELDPIIHRYMNSFTYCIRKAAEQNDGVVDMTHWFSNQLFAVISPHLNLPSQRWCGIVGIGGISYWKWFWSPGFWETNQRRKTFFPGSRVSILSLRSVCKPAIFIVLADLQFWAIPWLLPGFRLLPTPKWLTEMRRRTFFVGPWKNQWMILVCG